MRKTGILGRRLTSLFGGAVLAIGLLSTPGSAQNPFANVVQVDNAMITEFEIRQRSRFLQILNAPGSDRASVIQELINDRLRIAETRARGITLDDATLQQGLADFAARANLSTEAFTQALAKEGVSAETFRDFVSVQILWRDYIRARFGNRVQIAPEEIDRAAAQVNAAAAIEVLVSEIIIPAPPEQAQAVAQLAEEISLSKTQSQFSAYAREYSATASRDQGGRLNWLGISELPATLRPLLLSLSPGEVTPPLNIPNAVALFQLRDIREARVPKQSFEAVEYAAYYINGGRSPEALQIAANIRARADRCDDLYGIAKGQPEDVLERGSLPPSEIPQDIAIELAKLDPGEVSTALTRANGQTLVFLMLCGRTPTLQEDQEEVDRGAISAELRNQRLTAFSDNLLAELEAKAKITYFE